MPAITHESLALHALRALDEPDRQPFELHLATCDDCRANIEGLTAAASSLALAIAPVTPPLRLRARILEAASRAPNPEYHTMAAHPT